MLASLLLATVLTGQQAQAEPNVCQAMMADYDLTRFGVTWLSWTARERMIYIEGLVDGEGMHAEFISKQHPSAVRDAELARTAVLYDFELLGSLMTSLYGDAANVYIPRENMILIARDKIAGKDVAPLLREARRTQCSGTPKAK